jgi:D-cysteine desulfhydrase
VALAQTPTPLQRLSRLSQALGADVWIKRDDLTGSVLSGNKVRKLELLLGDAVAQGCDIVLTTGGLQSNHARATAWAARSIGIEAGLLLRGTLPAVPEGNLLLDRLAGAQLRTCTAEEYRWERDALLASWAGELRGKGRRPYVVPEGGSNALGSAAYTAAPSEQEALWNAAHHVVAVGSGGTLAGLAMAGVPGQVHGIAVCDDAATFEARVSAIAADAAAWGLTPPRDGGWEVIEGFQGPAYAVATPEIWETIAWVARLEGIALDPVYTGKAMHALVQRAAGWSGRIVFWHTGGMFGLFGRGAEIPA